MERIEAIENGDYDVLDDWDWEDAHYDDEPEMISDEQMDDLTGLFDTADSLFINGDIQASRDLYQALFSLLSTVKECDYVVPEPDIDMREERARYARCVYETSDNNQCVDAFADAMDMGASARYNKQNVNDTYPLLQDVMDAAKQEMKDIREFYPLWEKFLGTQGNDGRPASLLVEVVYLTKGLAGVGELARSWGDVQPYGYLFWLDKLRQETLWDELIDVAQNALAVLKPCEAREKVSVFLSKAGQKASNPAVVLDGHLEKFYSSPCDANLKALLVEAIKQDKREENLAQILDFYSRQKAVDSDEIPVYLKALLLAGNLAKAWEIAKAEKSLGWSYGSGTAGALVFGCVCAVAAGFHENAETIRRFLAWYCENCATYSYHFSVEEDASAGFFRDEIIKGLSRARFQASQLKTYTDWAFQIGRERVDAIVSNTHRSAYQRAAWVLGALAEIYAARADVKKAEALMYEYCKEKYNRHTAFKREVKQTISGSALLRQVQVLF